MAGLQGFLSTNLESEIENKFHVKKGDSVLIIVKIEIKTLLSWSLG